MLKTRFYVIRLKHFLLPIVLVLFTICLVLFSNSNLYAAKNGISLWANSIVPTLFPFFVAIQPM